MAIYLSDMTGATATAPFHDSIMVWTSGAVTTAGTNKGYFVDTSGGSKSIALPADPNDGDMVAFVDSTESFKTNNLIVTRNGKKIMGLEEDMTAGSDKASFKLIYNGLNGDWRLSYVSI